MIDHRLVDVNGLRLHLAEAGPVDGPVALLLHGFPECWYSWRHQLAALAEAGFHVVAPDQRGYARSDAPADVTAYTMLHLVGDAIGVLDAVGADRALVVGHDWGAPVAWHTAMLRPDRVRGVVGLSVPFTPRSAGRPTEGLARRFGAEHYILYFQEPGVADAELGADPERTFRVMLASVAGGRKPEPLTAPPGKGFLGGRSAPGTLPGWLTDADVATYVGEYAERGFTGGLNWYRNIDRNWELTAAWAGATTATPALYIGGADDPVVLGFDRDSIEAALRQSLTDLRGTTLLAGCGHWIQQERPDEVNAALLEFATGLD
ncbi:alpha/beta hydrolase [Actinomycetes bacterium KLBMP 9759]